MRQITRDSIAAFMKDKPFKRDNTEVESVNNITYLFLFRNMIAYKRPGKRFVTITNAGHFTRTTKERLNGIPNVSIHHSKNKWYLNGNLWDGTQYLIKTS